eukprot:4352351-Amphidinium_carterae.1
MVLKNSDGQLGYGDTTDRGASTSDLGEAWGQIGSWPLKQYPPHPRGQSERGFKVSGDVDHTQEGPEVHQTLTINPKMSCSSRAQRFFLY